MIVEEKKAGELTCPQSIHGDAVYKDTCRGSRCMAWRWADTTEKLQDNEYGTVCGVGPPSTTHGYCGLAGRP